MLRLAQTRFQATGEAQGHPVIYILIILLSGPGGYGFSTEFNTVQACEYAAAQARLAPFATNAFCAAKGAVDTPAPAVQPRTARSRPPRHVALPYWQGQD